MPIVRADGRVAAGIHLHLRAHLRWRAVPVSAGVETISAIWFQTMKYTAAILFTAFIVIIIVLADLGRLPRFLNSIYDMRYGDKIGHFVLFGLLDFFITRAALSALPLRRPVWVALSASLILALLVGLEEYSQNYFRERTAELIDLLAGYFGMLIGGLTALKRHSVG